MPKTEQAKIVSPQSFMQQLLANELNINNLRSNALLRKDEWKEFDTTVVEVTRQRLNGIADLQARGLTLSLGGLGTLVSQYEAQSDMEDAEINMAGVTPGEEDSIEFDIRSVPIPIIHKDFRINIRRLEASRKLGDSVDTTQSAVAGRRVSDKMEDMLFNGAGITVDGNTIPGYTNATGITTGSLSTWDHSTNQGNIYGDILDMIQDAHDAHYYGPFVVYIASNRWQYLLGVYDDGSGQTPLQRILNIPGIEEVKASDVLSDNTALMVQMTRDVVDLAVAQDVTTVQWDSQGGMQVHFKVMAALAPRVKRDYNGNTGIVYYS